MLAPHPRRAASSGSGHRAAGSGTGDEVGDPSRGLSPDLRSGRRLIRISVDRVVVLTPLPGPRSRLGDVTGDRVLRPRIVGFDRCRTRDHRCPVSTHQGELLGRHLVQHDEDTAVTTLSGERTRWTGCVVRTFDSELKTRSGPNRSRSGPQPQIHIRTGSTRRTIHSGPTGAASGRIRTCFHVLLLPTIEPISRKRIAPRCLVKHLRHRPPPTRSTTDLAKITHPDAHRERPVGRSLSNIVRCPSVSPGRCVHP